MKINGKDISNLGFKGYCIGESLKIYQKNFEKSGLEKSEILGKFKEVYEKPENYLKDEIFNTLATRLYVPPKQENSYELLETPVPYTVYGKEQIEEGAIQQMDTACRLPVSRYGALMPDAHTGYGLPIGGVLAVKDAIIPFAVGVDIGCMMHMSVIHVDPSYLKSYKDKIKHALESETRFGVGCSFERDELNYHEVLENDLFDTLPLLKGFKQKAWSQLGTSGSGNHFVEFGIFKSALSCFSDKIALLSHSGSRQLGAMIAAHYTKLAMEQCKLPKEAKNLAWLDMNGDGEEYWHAMQLAGAYAQANHECIHERLLKKLGWNHVKEMGIVEVPASVISNKHNFAWKETIDGEELIVHRKGATPAYKDQIGIIPGSMSTDTHIVSGLGNRQSLFSASHGAGRKMSRTAARNSFTVSDMKKDLKAKDIELIGGAIDECTNAYKDIEEVIQIQSDNDIICNINRFSPKIVRMSKDKGDD